MTLQTCTGRSQFKIEVHTQVYTIKTAITILSSPCDFSIPLETEITELAFKYRTFNSFIVWEVRIPTAQTLTDLALVRDSERA